MRQQAPAEPQKPEFVLVIATSPPLGDDSLDAIALSLPPVENMLLPATRQHDWENALVPLPTLTLILPPPPPVVAPDPAAHLPELPKTDDPELKARRPLHPQRPPFGDFATTDPPLVAAPSPACRCTPPPLLDTALPDRICSVPPAALVPLPTHRSTRPPRPAVEAADPALTCPLFPQYVDPELKAS